MKSKGVCKLCEKTYTGQGMTRHLTACLEKEKANDKGKSRIFLLKAGDGPFWIYFEVNAKSELAEVDVFLRDLWLECCGHMSAFRIGNTDYMSHDDFLDLGEKGMDVPLEEVIKPGTKFRHEYDFGSTTELELECISERQGKKLKDIVILARNDIPELLCDECGKPATQICTECVWEGEGFLCESCAEDHECGEEMMLPVVNSPRMGVCGYTG
ncbi:hypothetical protein GF312_16635 [Candidatus Poribacteria bacterium]|nr:hypothetical protein [Candidatus Poribacteria bacterium]